jgi:hypothetical protein
MSSRELWSGIGFGLLASLCGAIAYLGLMPFIGPSMALRGVIVLLALATAAWTLHKSKARVGRVVAGAAWLVLCGALVVFDPRLWLWLLLVTLALWLTRSLYRYQRLSQAFVDGALSLFALAAGIAALGYSHSLFLALWSYFLVHSLTALIPIGANEPGAQAVEEDPYDRAHRSADAALRRLANP